MMRRALICLAALQPSVASAFLEPDPPETGWAYSASVYAYFVPDDLNYLQPTIAADRGWLHIEARYNYEDIETGSVWAGYNFGWGDEVTLDLTPMAGAAFGSSSGFMPGTLVSVAWWKLDFYGEAEYFIASGGESGPEDGSENYFYIWSEFAISPEEWLRLGLVSQRTRAYGTDLDIQRGIFVGGSFDMFTLTGHAFNIGWDDPTFVLSIEAEF